LIKRALLSVFFGGCLVAAGLALSPSQNDVVILPHNNTTLAATPPRLPGLKVFSWYLVYLYDYFSAAAGSGGDPASNAVAVAGFKKDIQDAQATGIDGFVVFIYNSQQVFNNTVNMFEAARQLAVANPSDPPFLLCISPQTINPGDVSQLFPGSSTNWILYWMQAFVHHPNYYYYQGKAVLSSFLGLDSQSQSDWVNDVFTPLAGQGVNVFFTPSILDPTASQVTTGGTTLTAWGQTYIGSLNWWAGSEPITDINNTNSLANINIANGKPVVVNLSGAPYWAIHGTPRNDLYMEHYGGEGPDQCWRAAMPLNPIFIMETTWNDFTESYTSPIDIPVPTVNTGYSIEDLLKPHRGYSELRKYYVQWYTTGVQPVITKDLLIYFYRTSAQSLNTFTPTTFSPATIPDVIFIATRLTAPAALSVSTGGNVTTYNLPAGVNFTRIPFSVGSQQFQLIRGGVVIASIAGEAVVGSIPKNNLEFTTGFVYAP
jgi:Glycosyl hydrolase family 71